MAEISLYPNAFAGNGCEASTGVAFTTALIGLVGDGDATTGLTLGTSSTSAVFQFQDWPSQSYISSGGSFVVEIKVPGNPAGKTRMNSTIEYTGLLGTFTEQGTVGAAGTYLRNQGLLSQPILLLTSIPQINSVHLSLSTSTQDIPISEIRIILNYTELPSGGHIRHTNFTKVLYKVTI